MNIIDNLRTKIEASGITFRIINDVNFYYFLCIDYVRKSFDRFVMEEKFFLINSSAGVSP